VQLIGSDEVHLAGEARVIAARAQVMQDSRYARRHFGGVVEVRRLDERMPVGWERQRRQLVRHDEQEVRPLRGHAHLACGVEVAEYIDDCGAGQMYCAP
jgi:hypothetical protein